MNYYQFKFLVPLINFESETPSIDLQKGLTIRKISPFERKEIHELVKQWSDITYGKFLLEYVVVKKNPQSNPHAFRKEASLTIEKAITILRLYKQNIIGSNVLLQPLGKPAPYSTTTYTLKHYQSLWLGSDKKYAPKKYKLSIKEAGDFKQFFKELYRMNFAPFESARRYFNQSYAEFNRPHDSLMDLLHALENLYLRGDNQELAYTKHQIGPQSSQRI